MMPIVVLPEERGPIVALSTVDPVDADGEEALPIGVTSQATAPSRTMPQRADAALRSASPRAWSVGGVQPASTALTIRSATSAHGIILRLER
jgi:hypothetical protein